MGRDVAIKLSGQDFSDRFEREARAVAALDHANICTLYDVGPNHLVMELVHGESPKGPLPFDTALGYARQIADALIKNFRTWRFGVRAHRRRRGGLTDCA